MSQSIPSSPNTSYERYFQIALSFASVKLGLLLVKHPVYIIQTYKQAFPNLSNVQIITEIYQRTGVRGFYRSTPMSITKILVTESYRGVLMIEVPNQIESYLPRHWSQAYPTPTTLLTSALATPIISAIDSSLLCPLLRLNTLQMTHSKKASIPDIYNNFVKGNTFKTLYRGYTPLFLQTSLAWGNFFIIDDLMKQILQNHCNGISYFGLSVTSVIGGSLQTCISIVPDTIRVQMQKTTTSNHLSMRATTRQLIQQHGISGLFSALPHKVGLGIITYSYKSMLRHFWTSPSKQSSTST